MKTIFFFPIKLHMHNQIAAQQLSLPAHHITSTVNQQAKKGCHKTKGCWGQQRQRVHHIWGFMAHRLTVTMKTGCRRGGKRRLGFIRRKDPPHLRGLATSKGGTIVRERVCWNILVSIPYIHEARDDGANSVPRGSGKAGGNDVCVSTHATTTIR